MRPKSTGGTLFIMSNSSSYSFISEVLRTIPAVALIVQGGMGVVQFKMGKLHCVAGGASFWPSCYQTANYAETLTLRIIAESHFVKGTYS